jgi:two-component system OmpR family response regulator
MTDTAMTSRVLLVDDNIRIMEEMSLVFESAGYLVDTATDALELRSALSKNSYDLVFLDLNLPGEDGLSCCRWLRSVYPDIGVVMLTARVMGGERAEGYSAGADIYLTKPTRAEEVLSATSNLMRRIQRAKVPVHSDHCTWTLNTSDLYLVSPNAEAISLTAKECAVLKRLAQVSGVCGYVDILDALLVDSAKPSEKAKLEVIISRLRQKLNRLHTKGMEIRTVVGSGYRLMTPLLIKNAKSI